MGLLKLSVFVACYATSLSAAAITSGSISLNSQSSGSFTLTLSDGFSFSGTTNSRNPIGTFLGCFPSVGTCQVGTIDYLNLNEAIGPRNDNFSGIILPTVVSFSPQDTTQDQTFSAPITATGTVVSPYTGVSDVPCLLPTGDASRPLCPESFSGTGLATVTISKLGEELYIRSTTLVFSTPEPYSFLLVILPLACLPLRRHFGRIVSGGSHELSEVYRAGLRCGGNFAGSGDYERKYHDRSNRTGNVHRSSTCRWV